MTVVVHYLKGSRGHRIVWLLEELGVPYDITVYTRASVSSPMPAEFQAISPTGTSPTVVDDGEVLTESAFIVDKLMAKYGKGSSLEPRNPKEADDVKYALFAAEGNIMEAGVGLLVNKLALQQMPYGVSFLTSFVLGQIDRAHNLPLLKRTLNLLQAQIDKNGGFYTGNHLTAADIMYEYDVCLFHTHKIIDIPKAYPGLAEYLDSMALRPAYQRALKAEHAV